jgi:hypothetical protein
MHEDLHETEHLPQCVHLLSLTLILIKEIFEISPSKVPTGQIILQYNLPFRNERIPTSRKKITGTTYASILNPLIGILFNV